MSNTVQFNEALVKLDIHEKRFHLLLQSPSFEKALERLDDLKREVRRKRRLLAKQFHPDIAGEEGLGRMKEINFAAEALLKLHIQPRPPQPVIRVMHFGFEAANYTGLNTASTTSTTYTSSFRYRRV